MKLDFSAMLSERMLFEVPNTAAASRRDILARFDETVLNEKTQRSAYRSIKKLSLDFDKSLKLAEKFRAKFKRLLVLGTGGSSLGTKALCAALAAKCDREVLCIENLDAADLPAGFTKADYEATGIVAISKSGGTLETLLALSHFENQYTRHELAIKNHFAIITDAGSKSPLTQWAQDNDVEQIFMDPGLGGRWSITSTVGAFPIAFSGINFNSFFAGIESRFKAPPADDAIDFSLRLADLDSANFQVHSLWHYSSALKEIGAWWRQLWSESLGKLSDGVTKGAFALPCVGAVDQHSVLQQLYEGHASSYAGFVFVDKVATAKQVEKLSPAIKSKFAACEGKDWSDIMKAQGRATLQSLHENGRPTYTIKLTSVDEKSLGDLMAFWMDVVALTGCALKVNPFDQPGVERAKKIFQTLI